MSIDKEQLLKPHADTEVDVEVPGLGGTVRVRGLTRGEVFSLQHINDGAKLERRTVALAMVDPEMTETEVGRWQEASPAGELQAVAAKIQELSGLGEGATKSGVQAAGDDPGAGV